MRTITIANQKGGCGKTTTAINLSASLAREGRRVLLVDLDPQAHCALGMAVPEEQIDLSIFDCLIRQMEGEPLELSRITWQIAPNLDLAPSRSNLATLEPRLATHEDADALLERLLELNVSRYDYCVVDCPPHLGLLMQNGLRAADDIIIPVDTGYFSLHGLTQQLAMIEQEGERNGSNPSVRVLANQYDVRTKLAREILAELRKRFKDVVCETIVNFNTKLKEGASYGQPITEFAPTSMGARDFQKLARELIASEPAKTATGEILEHVERLAADAERLLATTTTLVDNREGTAAEPATPAGPVTAPPAEVLSAGAIVETAPYQAAPGQTPKVLEPSLSEWEPIAARPSPPAERPSPPSEPLSRAEIDRKIEAIYGVRQEGEALVFRSHNPDAGEVCLAGDFNDWMPHTTPMRRLPAGDFETRLRLPQGRYRYRLVVDGRWSHDHFNPATEMNEYGELNSIVEVKR
ncbi:MAG: AAA family ATPase [Phycisphaerales bacterium]|nr:MAG: AAA family ATPase [Phycisphaerales bacterium]